MDHVVEFEAKIMTVEKAAKAAWESLERAREITWTALKNTNPKDPAGDEKLVTRWQEREREEEIAQTEYDKHYAQLERHRGDRHNLICRSVFEPKGLNALKIKRDQAQQEVEQFRERLRNEKGLEILSVGIDGRTIHSAAYYMTKMFEEMDNPPSIEKQAKRIKKDISRLEDELEILENFS